MKKRKNSIKRRVDSVEGRLTRVEQKVDVIQRDVDVLKEDVKVLKEDVRVLKEDMVEVKSDLAQVKETQAEHSETLVFLVKNFNEFSKELTSVKTELRGLVDSLPRWFEMAQENHRSEMRAWRDLLHANGLRLDDHEERLLQLEAR